MSIDTQLPQTERRDDQGRHWTAPAWSGDLALLDANELAKRAEYIGDHIARSTSRFASTGPRDTPFVVAVNLAEIQRWATVRVACLNELERRADEAGVVSIDLVLAAPSWELS